MASRVLIDTNVFMYAAGGPHRYREACRRIVADLVPDRRPFGRDSACVDAELFQEIAYRYASIGKGQTGQRLQRSIRALDVELLAVDEPTIALFIEAQSDYAEELERRGDLVRDLLHLAVMRRHHVERVVSADTDFDRFEGIRRLDPLEMSP